MENISIGTADIFSDNFKYVSHHDSREEAEAVVKDRAVGGEVGTKETWTDFSQPATSR